MLRVGVSIIPWLHRHFLALKQADCGWPPHMQRHPLVPWRAWLHHLPAAAHSAHSAHWASSITWQQPRQGHLLGLIIPPLLDPASSEQPATPLRCLRNDNGHLTFHCRILILPPISAIPHDRPMKMRLAWYAGVSDPWSRGASTASPAPILNAPNADPPSFTGLNGPRDRRGRVRLLPARQLLLRHGAPRPEQPVFDGPSGPHVPFPSPARPLRRLPSSS